MNQRRNVPKRLLSLLLAVVMVFGMLPTTIFASAEEPEWTGSASGSLGTYIKNGSKVTYLGIDYDTVDENGQKEFYLYGEVAQVEFNLSYDLEDKYKTGLQEGDSILVRCEVRIKGRQYVQESTKMLTDYFEPDKFQITDTVGGNSYSIGRGQTYQLNVSTVGLGQTCSLAPSTFDNAGSVRIPATVKKNATGQFYVEMKLELAGKIRYMNYLDNSDNLYYSQRAYTWDNTKSGINRLTRAGIELTVNMPLTDAIEYQQLPDAPLVVVNFFADTTGEASSDSSYIAEGGFSDGVWTLPTEEAIHAKTPEGKKFAGWYEKTADGTLAATAYAFPRLSAGETLPKKLYAKWEDDRDYTVTLKANGTNVYLPEQSVSVASGSVADLSECTPQRDGYNFIGWYLDSACAQQFDLNTEVRQDYKLYAGWERIGGPVSATVSFEKQSGNEADKIATNWPNSVTAGANGDATIPVQTPQAEGWVFGGWKNATDTTDTTTYLPGNTIAVTENTQLIASWSKAQYTIAYVHATGATFSEGSTSVFYGEKASFELTVAAGYDPATVQVTENNRLLGWTDKRNNADGSTTYVYTFKPIESTTVKASAPEALKYTVTLPLGEHYTVAFTDDATVSAKNDVAYNGTVSFTVEPDKGWTVRSVVANGDCELTSATENGVTTYTVSGIKSNVSVGVAMKEVQTFVVYYIIDGMAFTEQKVDEGTQLTTTLLSAPSKTGHTFKGWYNSAEYQTLWTGDTVSGDVYLYGHYEPDEAKIFYDLNVPTDALNVNPAKANGADYAIAPTAKKYGVPVALSSVEPESTNYDFLGWSKDRMDRVVAYAPGAIVSEELSSDMTLYAVWAKKTYNVTVNPGVGYTIHTDNAQTTVQYGENFSFRVIAGKDYRQYVPTIWMNPKAEHKITKSYDTKTDGVVDGRAYWYTVGPIYADTSINLQAHPNQSYKVSYVYYGLADDHELADKTYLEQMVGWKEKTVQPVAPKVDGYQFDNWYTVTQTDRADGSGKVNVETLFDFSSPITGETTVYAKFIPIQPWVTFDNLNGTGWSVENVKYITSKTETVEGEPTPVETETEVTGNPFQVPYGADVTFDLVIEDGYDYSDLSVAADGYALVRAGDPRTEQRNATVVTPGEGGSTEESVQVNVTVIPYRLVKVTADTRISVMGVERKTITITYDPNARDQVSGLPGKQIVNYYVTGLQNTDITSQEPKRTGYAFLGWSTNSEATSATVEAGDDKLYKYNGTNKVADFTSDMTLYAIWEASDLSVELTFAGQFYTATGSEVSPDGKLDYAYEGDSITLNGTLSQAAQGTMAFFKKLHSAEDTEANWTLIDSKATNGGKYVSVTVPVESYHTTDNIWDYKVVFTPTTDEGYVTCESTDQLRVYSKAIAWSAAAGNSLTIYKADGTTKTTSMVADNTYYLELPNVVELDGGQRLKEGETVGDVLTVGDHYTILWQYKNETEDWVDYKTTRDSNRVLITPEYSEHVFRALVYPAESSIYTKAAKYDAENKRIDNKYWDWLSTQETVETLLETSKTSLSLIAPSEDGGVLINGETSFADVGTHYAQYEGETVTLTATVTLNDGTTAIDTGTVDFYRRVDDGDDVLLNAEPRPVGENGVATFEVATSAFSGTATEAKDVYYAVYRINATYNTSTSADGTVYIKSTVIQKPIIDSKNAGLRDGSTANDTSYDKGLTDLLAGVEHTFTLRTTAGTDAGKADYSVVALDGRAVSADDYEISWIVKTGDNDETDAAATATFTTSDNKNGDYVYVKLTAKNHMKTNAQSMKVIIGKKQDVVVTVSAIDAIAATTTGNPDVYEKNEIELQAIVAAADESASMEPTGIVEFFYVNDVTVDNVTTTEYVGLGKAQIVKGTDGVLRATIKTDKLPVEADGTCRDVIVSAVYMGNDTFKPSANWEEEKITASSIDEKVISTTVTVYSSKVYNCADSNKEQTTANCKGIHITVSDGTLKAHETNVTLKLGDIYTLDRELTDTSLRDVVAKLDPNTDYTVKWQKLTGNYVTDGDYSDASGWIYIDDATGTTVTLNEVGQAEAYRAEITVKNPKTPIVMADETLVYYSNVLTSNNGQATVSVALNTSKNGENLEGVTEGETVTANVFVSGAVGAEPNASVTIQVTNDAAKGNTEEYEKDLGSRNTVNGWNAFEWDTTGVAPGYYTLTITANSNKGYDPCTITRSVIVRESSYGFSFSNATTTYNGRAQGLAVTLSNFDFAGTGVNEAAAKSWNVKYYNTDGKLVEPSDAGTYRAVVTLPASAYWTEQTAETSFTIQQRKVSVADIIAQAKVYNDSTSANIVEVMLEDAETAQTTTGLPVKNTGVLNGDSIYATAKGVLTTKDAGKNTITATEVTLHGDDKTNYVLDSDQTYSEAIYVSRSQVYGSSATLELKKGESFPAEKVIKMIDQSGRVISRGTGTEDYTLTFYYHSDTEIRQTETLDKLGLYTVVARPNQNNFKGGVTMQFEVVESSTVIGALGEPKNSTLITIDNTAEAFGSATGATATATNGADISKIEYQSASGWSNEVPANAGRYLVKVTADTGDVAYGIYTIAKVNPNISITPEDADYNSMPHTGYSAATEGGYVTYAGEVAIGGNEMTSGNIDEQAPVDAGTYTVTLHVNETTNYTAHEVTETFEIARAELKVTADSWQTSQYGAFPDMTATYEGLAYEEGDQTPDTSLRDVQIAPEFLYNPKDGVSNYSNTALDQVGGVVVQPIDALAKNYNISYTSGSYTKPATEPDPTLDIHGLPQNSGNSVLVYYGDEIQLYPYGNYSGFANDSSLLAWSVETDQFDGTVSINEKTGLLTVQGVGTFTVTLTRGEGTRKITKSVDVTAIRKEVQIVIPDQNLVYNGRTQNYDGSKLVAYDLNWFEITDPVAKEAASNLSSNSRSEIGTQLVEAKEAQLKYYQYRTYNGKFTVNDKDAAVTPAGQTTVYGETESFDTSLYTVEGTVSSVAPVEHVKAVAQTDSYNRLDVLDGYEILVAGTEDINYNVRYVTNKKDGAGESCVTVYTGVKLYSTTTKAKSELNDATVYGDQANALDWILEKAIEGDSLADYNIADSNGVFIAQDYDRCVDNTVTYKAANRKCGNTDSSALESPRTSANTGAHANYVLKFMDVTNAKAQNYQLTNTDERNVNQTMTAPTGTVGFIGASATGDNLVEGSANIAQRAVTLQAQTGVELYWHLTQKQFYQAFLNILTAEGLANGHTIKDLDLTFTITVDSASYTICSDEDEALNISSLNNPTAKVVVKVGDTNYKLSGDSFEFNITLKKIQIEATYTTKSATGFTVLIKKHLEDGTTEALTDSTGLTYKIFKKTGDVVDTSYAYATGTLTYQNQTSLDDQSDLCGVFTASYSTLPSLGTNETYFIQMYEYGLELKTNR